MRSIVFCTLLVLVPTAQLAAQQCPSSAVRVEVVGGGTPSCVDATPVEDEPELNIANNCGDDQFNIVAGVDCPNCGPPLTLRAGTFGSFIVDTRSVSQFEPDSPSEEHVLEWALGNDTGTLTARVVPDITICLPPDMGAADMQAIDEADPGPSDEGGGGCSTSGGAGGPVALLLALLLAAPQRRRNDREQQGGH